MQNWSCATRSRAGGVERALCGALRLRAHLLLHVRRARCGPGHQPHRRRPARARPRWAARSALRRRGAHRTAGAVLHPPGTLLRRHGAGGHRDRYPDRRRAALDGDGQHAGAGRRRRGGRVPDGDGRRHRAPARGRGTAGLRRPCVRLGGVDGVGFPSTSWRHAGAGHRRRLLDLPLRIRRRSGPDRGARRSRRRGPRCAVETTFLRLPGWRSWWRA